MNLHNPEYNFLVYYQKKDSPRNSLAVTKSPSSGGVVIGLIDLGENHQVNKITFSETGVSNAHRSIHDKFQTNGHGHVVLNFIAEQLFDIRPNSNPELVLRQLQTKTKVEVIENADDFIKMIAVALINMRSIEEDDFSNN